MRIGIDVHAAEREGAGNCTYIRGLVRALLEIDGDNEYILYVTNADHLFYAELTRHRNATLRTLWPAQAIFRIPRLATASYRDRLDVLHVQYVGPPWHHGKLVVTIHDVGFLSVPESFPVLQRWRLRWQVAANARRASAVITGSQYSKGDIQRNYRIPADRIAVIYDAAEPHFVPACDDGVQAAMRQRLGIRCPYVLCVGRVNPRKNLIGVLQAFERVRPTLAEPVQLVIAGPRDYRADTLDEAIRRSPCRDDVVRAGYVPDAELPALFTGARVFVYPSFFEGFGLPPIEAMACGTPVISSAVASLAEVVGDAAMIVDPASVDDIAAALLRLLGDATLRASLTHKGFERAARFSWRTAAQQTLEVYRGVGRS